MTKKTGKRKANWLTTSPGVGTQNTEKRKKQKMELRKREAGWRRLPSGNTCLPEL